MEIVKFLLIVLVEFSVGSIMFSYILGKLSGKDITTLQDKNPGAANLWKLTNWKLGMLGIFLDYLKGFMPLYFFIQRFNFSVIELLIVSIAPLLGCIFSPFLKFKGGKGITVTFGIWSALTTYEVPVLLGVVFVVFYFIKPKNTSPEYDVFRVITGMIISGLFIYLRHRELFTIFIANFLLIVWTHRKELLKLIRINEGVTL